MNVVGLLIGLLVVGIGLVVIQTANTGQEELTLDGRGIQCQAFGGTCAQSCETETLSYSCPQGTVCCAPETRTPIIQPTPTRPFEPPTDFLEEVYAVAQRQNLNPEYLLAVMHFETGGSFDPCEKNRAGSSATGLIQFLESTARGLGTSTQQLCRMSRAEQMRYVEKYFEEQIRIYGPLETIEDTYLAVLCPVAIRSGIMTVDKDRHPNEERNYCGKTADHNNAYIQNAGLDRNDDGIITAQEATSRVRSIHTNTIAANRDNLQEVIPPLA